MNVLSFPRRRESSIITCMSANKNEENLRPKLLKDYIGQENVSKTLKMFIDAVNKRGKPS